MFVYYRLPAVLLMFALLVSVGLWTAWSMFPEPEPSFQWPSEHERLSSRIVDLDAQVSIMEDILAGRRKPAVDGTYAAPDLRERLAERMAERAMLIVKRSTLKPRIELESPYRR